MTVQHGPSEQLLRRLGTAARVDVEVGRVAADRDPQPGAARPARVAKRLHAPRGLVGMAQRRRVLVREDRLGQRLEQRHEAGHAVGQRPRGERQPLAGHPGGYALQGAQAGVALEQEARPDAGAVG